MNIEAIKPGPKTKKEDGSLDKRRRDNKNTPGNKPSSITTNYKSFP